MASGTSEAKQQTRQRSQINELIATIMRRTFALNHFVRTFVYLILRFSLPFAARSALGARRLFRIFGCLSALAFSVFDFAGSSKFVRRVSATGHRRRRQQVDSLILFTELITKADRSFNFLYLINLIGVCGIRLRYRWGRRGA